jgi:hypothetical protein
LVGIGSGSRPVHIRGTIDGVGPDPAVDLDIWGEKIPLDERLIRALPPKEEKLTRSFHPRGTADFVIQLRRQAGAAQFANRITVRVHDTAVRYDAFPYPLEQVSGVLEIFPDHFEFRDFRGVHKGGEFRTWGRSHPLVAGNKQVRIAIRGTNLLLDDELKAALAPKVRSAWEALAPQGRMNVAIDVEQMPDRPEDVAVTVTAQGCTLRPTFFPYLLSEVSGTVRYAHGKVELERLSGRHGSSLLTLGNGEIHLKPTGGFWARLQAIQGQPLIMDSELRTALPPALQRICGILHPGTHVGLAGELVIDMPSEPNLPPDIWWDGGVALHDAVVDAGVRIDQVRGRVWLQGRHDGRRLKGIKGNLLLDQAVLFRQPFRDIHTHLLITPETPEVLRMPDLKARIFGGNIGGEARLEFGPRLHYEINLTALQVRLEELGQHNLGTREWKGQASGRLYLNGHGPDIHGLEGHGSFDVPDGQMYNLPLLLDLIKVLGLRPPDRTAFEEAHAEFSIRGPRVVVNRLDLDGNAVSLSGQGELNLDGSDLQLDFYAVWGRIKQVLPPIFRDIPPALGQQLLKIKMRGTVNDPKITKEPVPGLIEPMENLVKRFTARAEEARSRRSPAVNRLP